MIIWLMYYYHIMFGENSMNDTQEFGTWASGLIEGTCEMYIIVKLLGAVL